MNTCPICLNRVIGKIQLGCKHSYCESCISKWFVKSGLPDCPYCRTPATFDEIDNAYKFEATKENLIEGVAIEIILSDLTLDQVKSICIKIGVHKGIIYPRRWKAIMETIISDHTLTGLFSQAGYKTHGCYFPPDKNYKKIYFFTF